MQASHRTACVRRANGLRYWALGRMWILFGSRENSKPEKCSKMPQNPQRPVHALLGVRLQTPMLDIRSHHNRAKHQFFCPIRSFV